jgi:hypothetical protein
VPVCPGSPTCACKRPSCRRPRRYPPIPAMRNGCRLRHCCRAPACQAKAGGHLETNCPSAVVDAIWYVIHNGCVACAAGRLPGLARRLWLCLWWNANGATIAVHDAFRGQVAGSDSAAARTRRSPSTASPGSSAPAPWPVRKRGRTTALGWSPRRAAASSDISGQHQPPIRRTWYRHPCRCSGTSDNPTNVRTEPPTDSTASSRSNNSSARAVQHQYNSRRKATSGPRACTSSGYRSTSPRSHAILNATAAACAFNFSGRNLKIIMWWSCHVKIND